MKFNRVHYRLLKGRVTKYDKYNSSIQKNRKHFHLGNYNTAEEAFSAYVKAKEERLKELANLWRNKISKRVYNALLNYKVEIN
jgi:hypothetical protein